MMGVHEEPGDSGLDQVIQSKGDKRFLKNRDERFGQILGQRTQTRSQSGTEYESLSDFFHSVRQAHSHVGVALSSRSHSCKISHRGPRSAASTEHRRRHALLVLASMPATTLPMPEETVWRGRSS